MIHLGRNDPCHCGSGKKYKKCHLHADQRSHARIHPSQQESESLSAPVAIQQRRKQFSDLLSKTGLILEYLAREGEIEDASAELEAHRSEFEKLLSDQDRCQAVGQAVFAGECFAPLRFTASDVQRAFDHVGYPATLSPDERTLEIFRAAILHVADKERRSRLAMGLLLRLPEFVAAGRYAEAWLLQCSAVQTTEEDDKSNPFLFEMFSYGYDAWAAEKRLKDESLIRQLGLDPDRLRAMRPDELDSWIQSQGFNDANPGALEAFFQENPHVREESVANFEALERNSARLLERPDSRFLQLPIEEVRPWLMRLNDCAEQQGFLSGTPGAAAAQESVRKVFEAVVLPLLREMADSIFSRDRIRQLTADLRAYQKERIAAGDEVTAGHAMGAICYLEREDSPGQNGFLINLCWRSLGSAIDALTAEGGT